jgi:hypothetical protein
MFPPFVKAFGLIYPFVVEVFFGKKYNRKKKPPPVTLLKKVMLAVGVGSFLLCFFLGKQLWAVSVENTKLRRKAESPPRQIEVPVAASAPPPPAAAEPNPTPSPVIAREQPPVKKPKKTYHQPVQNEDAYDRHLQALQGTDQ